MPLIYENVCSIFQRLNRMLVTGMPRSSRAPRRGGGWPELGTGSVRLSCTTPLHRWVVQWWKHESWHKSPWHSYEHEHSVIVEQTHRFFVTSDICPVLANPPKNVFTIIYICKYIESFDYIVSREPRLVHSPSFWVHSLSQGFSYFSYIPASTSSFFQLKVQLSLSLELQSKHLSATIMLMWIRNTPKVIIDPMFRQSFVYLPSSNSTIILFWFSITVFQHFSLHFSTTSLLLLSVSKWLLPGYKTRTE